MCNNVQEIAAISIKMVAREAGEVGKKDMYIVV